LGLKNLDVFVTIYNNWLNNVAHLLMPKGESPKIPAMQKNFAFPPKKRDKSKFELKQGLHDHFLLFNLNSKYVFFMT
jgi:hypothetical protein